MKTTNKFTGIFILATLIAVSCTHDEIDSPERPEQDPQVTFSLQAPRAGTKAGTKAAPGTGLTDEEERVINNLTILVFTENATPDLLCEYVLENLQPIPVPGTENGQYTVTATLPKGYYRLMFLANVADKITADPPIGKMLSTIESTLLHEMQAKWDIYAHPGFPMSGATTGLIMVTGSHTYPEPIVMLRMLARINLSVASDVKDNIKINAIHLYNPSSRGLVMPSEANLDTTTANGYIRAMAPTLPLNTAGTPDPGLLATPWEYTSAEILNGDSCHNTIYAMEGFDPQGLSEDEYAWLELTCSYKDQPEEIYRIDFLRTLDDGSREPMGLLRNHSYEIVILSMSGKTELEFEVMEWNDADMSAIVFEGKYFLKVRQSNFIFDMEEQDENSFNNKITVETNYEDGWSLDRITGSNNGAIIDPQTGWIQMTTSSGGEGKTENILLLLEENNTGSSRTAELHLQVGRLIDFIVTVTQQNNRKVEIYIEDANGNPLDEIIFYDYYGNTTTYEPKSFRVRWSPHGSNSQGIDFPCDILVTQVGDNVFNFKAGTEQITNGKISDANGVKEYTVEPERFTTNQVSELLGNPFQQHASWITFTVTDPDNANNTVSKTIYLNYQHLAIISRNFRRLSYLNRTYTFDVLSNTRWLVESVDNNDGIFTNSTQPGFYGGNDIVNGQQITYTMPADASNGTGRAGRKVTFYLRDQQGIMPNQVSFTVSAVYDDPNCYIVSPPSSGSTTLRIPIRKLFWIREREAGDATVTNLGPGQWEPGIVWEEYYDNDMNPINNYTVTMSKEPAGNVLEDVLVVNIPARTGGVHGNILVGVYRPGQNTYLWSWHIWLTDYNPEPLANGSLDVDDAWFMRRNIGALSGAELLNDRTTGFYYQWGRKDPLRWSDIENSSYRSPTNQVLNLLNAINNPQVFYYSTIAPTNDWYTNQTVRAYQNDYLWNDHEDNKTPYDPCPAGWRVPNLRELREESSGNSLWYQTQPGEDATGEVWVNGVLQGYRRRKRDVMGGDKIFMPAGGSYMNTGMSNSYGSENHSFNANRSMELNQEYSASHAAQNPGGAYNEGSKLRASALPVRCVRRKN